MFYRCLSLQINQNQKAFEHLGNALTYDPSNVKVRFCAYLSDQMYNITIPFNYFSCIYTLAI